MTVSALMTGFILENSILNTAVDSSFLFIPQSKYIKTASLGYENLVADIIYLWTIQYYGNTSLDHNYKQLEHLYNVITDLNPLFLEAYYIGALIMSIDAKDMEMALRLLDKGFSNNPEEWFLPMDAGFYCFQNKQYLRAAGYFEKASDIEPGSVAKRLYAGMFQKDHNYREALKQWTEVYESSDDPLIIKASARHIFDLTVTIDMENIKEAVSSYKKDYGKVPEDISKLVSKGYLKNKPLDPNGNPYKYNSVTGNAACTSIFDFQQ